MKILVDEDVSPKVAQWLCENEEMDATHVRDRGLSGKRDDQLLKIAFSESRTLVTANVRDFERLASSTDLHAGIICLEDGGPVRSEQYDAVRKALAHIDSTDPNALVNKLVYVAEDGTVRIESCPT